MRYAVFLLLISASAKLFAQTTQPDSTAAAIHTTHSVATVMVHKDPRVDALIKKQAQINEVTTRDSRRSMPGFRIQVIQSRDRNTVFAEKTKIYQQYPELQPYLIYQQPYYKLKVGNFKTQEEAENYQKQLTRLFPTGLIVVRDIIDVRPESNNP